MREILFRGKRIDNGEWIEGYYVKTVDYLNDSAVHLIIESPSTFYPRGEIAGEYEIIFSTVGQYTGLTDKNGRKIFEGDIVTTLAIGDKNRVVRFDGGGFCLDGLLLRYYRCFGKMAVKVIGNIHDNPELLEADK